MITVENFKEKLLTKKQEVNILVEDKLSELLKDNYISNELRFSIDFCLEAYKAMIAEELKNRGFKHISYDYEDIDIITFNFNIDD